MSTCTGLHWLCSLGELRQHIQVHGVVIQQELGQHIDRQMLITVNRSHQRFECIQPFPLNHGFLSSRVISQDLHS